MFANPHVTGCQDPIVHYPNRHHLILNIGLFIRYWSSATQELSKYPRGMAVLILELMFLAQVHVGADAISDGVQ